MEAAGWEQSAAEEAAPAEKEEVEIAKAPAGGGEAAPVASAPSPEMEVAAEPASAAEDETAPLTEVTLLDWLFSDAAQPDASYPRLRDFPTSQEAAKLLHDWLHS